MAVPGLDAPGLARSRGTVVDDAKSRASSRRVFVKTLHPGSAVMHRAGRPPVDAARLLGHTVQTHLAVYLPGDDAESQAAAEALGRALAAE